LAGGVPTQTPAHRVVNAPPFTWTVWPVMCRAPGEARKKTVSAMSPGVPGRRSVAVSLTDEGHALIERSVDSVLGREASLATGLSAAERATLATLLERLTLDVRHRMTTGEPPPADR
jgi:hypothetical protein